MRSLSIAIATQTPLYRFQPKEGHLAAAKAGDPDAFDRHLSPGGVCRMVLPSIRHWARAGWLRRAHWFSLQPVGPRELQIRDPPIDLHHLSLSPDELAAYARTKEHLWSDIHGRHRGGFGPRDFRFYTRYNWKTADAMLEAMEQVGLAYIHDFQLLQTGALIGLGAPAVFRWHVPFDPSRIPPYTRNFVLRAMEDFDIVVVSTRRDLRGLRKAGFKGVAHQLYPHLDPEAWPDVRPRQVQALEDRWHLGADDPLILCVARMDPIKRQDLLVKAFASARRRFPTAHLIFIGNGSFSGASKGGLGTDKAQEWLKHIQAEVSSLKLTERVHFAHWVPDDVVAAAYQRASAVVLPSDIEGFGLTVLEGWRYARPCIVSSGVGASEIVRDRQNGYVFAAGRDGQLADRLESLLRRREAAQRMGEHGRDRLRAIAVESAASREAEILEEAQTLFEGSP